MRYATIPGKPPFIVPSSYAPGCCWSWMRTPHPSLGALSGSWCPDVSSVFIARIGASATIERLHAKSIQKSDLPVIFLSLLIGQTPLRIWCCFEESIAVEEREKGTLEYCLIILLLSNIRDGFLHVFFYLFVTLSDFPVIVLLILPLWQLSGALYCWMWQPQKMGAPMSSLTAWLASSRR